MASVFDHVTDYLVLGLYCAAIYVMVRPGSKAATAVGGISNGLTQLATMATDFG